MRNCHFFDIIIFRIIDFHFDLCKCFKSACLNSPISLESFPSIWFSATFIARSVFARIRSMTASACDKSIRPLRNARFVNSPGSASRAPSFKTSCKHSIHSDNSTMTVHFNNIFTRKCFWCFHKRNHYFFNCFTRCRIC